MTAISKSTILSNIWENFYDRVNATITDPNVSIRSKWIYSTFPLEDIENRNIDYPIIIVNPVNILWKKMSLKRNYAMGSIVIETYSTSAATADSYGDSVCDGIETSRTTLRAIGLEFINLTGRTSEPVFRGKNTIHVNTITFEFRYVFTKTASW
jgi:hypothetical protein